MTTDPESPEIVRPRRKRPSSRRVTLIGVSAGVSIALIAAISVLTGGNVTDGKVLPTSQLVGHRVANFTLPGLYGGEIKAPWKSDRASVIVFFASSCWPCQGEMPKIANYIRSNNPHPVEVLGMDAYDLTSSAQAMIKKDDVTFPVAVDKTGAVTSGIFGFNAVPESVFINAKGVVTNVYFGAIPKQQLADGIRLLSAK
jgi:peroxiredoxin